MYLPLYLLIQHITSKQQTPPCRQLADPTTEPNLTPGSTTPTPPTSPPLQYLRKIEAEEPTFAIDGKTITIVTTCSIAIILFCSIGIATWFNHKETTTSPVNKPILNHQYYKKLLASSTTSGSTWNPAPHITPTGHPTLLLPHSKDTSTYLYIINLKVKKPPKWPNANYKWFFIHQ